MFFKISACNIKLPHFIRAVSKSPHCDVDRMNPCVLVVGFERPGEALKVGL